MSSNKKSKRGDGYSPINSYKTLGRTLYCNPRDISVIAEREVSLSEIRSNIKSELSDREGLDLERVVSSFYSFIRY